MSAGALSRDHRLMPQHCSAIAPIALPWLCTSVLAVRQPKRVARRHQLPSHTPRLPTCVTTSSWNAGSLSTLLPALSCRPMSGMFTPAAVRGGLLSWDQCSISSSTGATGMKKPVACASLQKKVRSEKGGFRPPDSKLCPALVTARRSHFSQQRSPLLTKEFSLCLPHQGLLPHLFHHHVRTTS